MKRRTHMQISWRDKKALKEILYSHVWAREGLGRANWILRNAIFDLSAFGNSVRKPILESIRYNFHVFIRTKVTHVDDSIKIIY